MASNIPYDTMSTPSGSNSFAKCCFCIPLRMGCFILGYAVLLINCTSIFFNLGMVVSCVINIDRFEQIERDEVKHALMFLVVYVLIRLVWLAVNIATLVGLHKKRPGPIRVFFGLPNVRLALFFIILTYVVVQGYTSTGDIVTQAIDLGLNAYFILMFYKYAIQLEHEQTQRLPGPGPDAISVIDVPFIYPKTLSEKHLIS